jgi:hypothetical protein
MGAGSRKKPAAPRKRKKRAGPVSLHPMEFDDAMRALLGVKPLKGREADLGADDNRSNGDDDPQ